MRDDDPLLREIFDRCRTIAVVGIKAGADDDAFRVPHYMQQHGHRILPISPKLVAVLGERCVTSLRELREPVDLVNLFRAPQHLPAHVDEILAMQPLPFAAWFQLGIRDDESAARLRAAGVRVVQDACLMVEHARLADRGHPQKPDQDGPASLAQRRGGSATSADQLAPSPSPFTCTRK